ncbi:MAG: antibiotic biosynthesis monooxygenase family protein [Candidatus Aminicenantales bacterium]
MPMRMRIDRRTGFIIPSQADSRDRPASGGKNMYVRMTTLSFHLEKYDEGVRMFDQSVVPAARAQKGFRAIYLLADRRGGRCVALTFWDDEAAALANEENRYYQEQLVKLLPYYASPPVREGFEVVVESR